MPKTSRTRPQRLWMYETTLRLNPLTTVCGAGRRGIDFESIALYEKNPQHLFFHKFSIGYNTPMFPPPVCTSVQDESTLENVQFR